MPVAAATGAALTWMETNRSARSRLASAVRSRRPDELIPGARQQDANPELLLQVRRDAAGDVERELLLLESARPHRAHVVPAVPRVDHERVERLRPRPLGRRRRRARALALEVEDDPRRILQAEDLSRRRRPLERDDQRGGAPRLAELGGRHQAVPQGPRARPPAGAHLGERDGEAPVGLDQPRLEGEVRLEDDARVGRVRADPQLDPRGRPTRGTRRRPGRLGRLARRTIGLRGRRQGHLLRRLRLRRRRRGRGDGRHRRRPRRLRDRRAHRRAWRDSRRRVGPRRISLERHPDPRADEGGQRAHQEIARHAPRALAHAHRRGQGDGAPVDGDAPAVPGELDDPAPRDEAHPVAPRPAARLRARHAGHVRQEEVGRRSAGLADESTQAGPRHRADLHGNRRGRGVAREGEQEPQQPDRGEPPAHRRAPILALGAGGAEAFRLRGRRSREEGRMVEAAGIEPASEDRQPEPTTPIVRDLALVRLALPRTGSSSDQPVLSRAALPRHARGASLQNYDARPPPLRAREGRTSPLVRRRVLALCRQL